MLKIDDSLIGRKYYTVDPNTIYTIRGVADGTGTLILLGEYDDGKTLLLTTTKVVDAKLVP
jgi:hypothetical protein